MLFFYACLYTVLLLILQHVLFAKTQNIFLQCIPLYCIAGIYLFSIGCILYDTLGFSVHDGYLFYSFLGWTLMIINTAALIADGIAWLIEKV